MIDTTAVAFLLAGVAIGIAVAWYVASGRTRVAVAEANQRALTDSQSTATELATAKQRLLHVDDQAARLKTTEEERSLRLGERDAARTEAGLLRTRAETAEVRFAAATDRAGALEGERNTARATLGEVQVELGALKTTHREVETRREKDAEAHVQRLADIEKAREEYTAQFQNLANELLEAKTKTLTETNTKEIGTLLDPLKERLAEFKAKVEEVYIAEGKERVALGEQVKQLTTLNQAMSKDAQGLTEALRGSSKVQGDWGELVLERILEGAGLREGHEFVTQVSTRDAEGNLLRPDVVLLLPNGRKVVIDSKVSLVAWVQYVEATDDDIRKAASGSLVASVRAHLRGLSPKAYETLYGIDSLDFVVMFVPLEGAFARALATEPALQDDAWKQQVLFSGPTTILFALRTIAHLWREERQAQNAIRIATDAGALIDKFATFVETFDRVGHQVGLAARHHEAARRLLVSGPGNVVRRIEALGRLGVQARKSLPDAWIAAADDVGDLGMLPAPQDEAQVADDEAGTASPDV